MILGIGTDLTEVARIRKTLVQYGDRFLKRIYTDTERAYASSKANAAERFAARFAAKEAAMKAIGTGWRRGVTWKDFEVANEPSGRPILRMTGMGRQIAEQMGVKRTTISLTHTAETALALVILEDGF
ncbi:MAG: holo-ACP synthase [Acidobacteriaceae bacterium]|nr:holo-ACP synthase [Acidobacteriaceae bacterium]MBV9294937.1 holo-ACP synthase [Acidobacteriaceae bacterium]MBV9763419.1 holo-ACP synthase [Acidobacteriaceae bacterium]